MPREHFREFIKNAKAEYKKIGHVECPAFRGEKVYFNRHGFNHLLKKEGVSRSASEKVRRLHLIKAAEAVILSSERLTEHRIIADHEFWSLQSRIGDKSITVIIRQMPGSEKHFFSVMDKKLPKNTKDR